MITLTDQAMDEIRSRLDDLQPADRTVRIFLRGGGCAGTRYDLAIGQPAADGDEAWDQDGIVVLCPADQLPLLSELVLDFSTGLMDGGFKYRNPKARMTCGCGGSFNPLQDGM